MTHLTPDQFVDAIEGRFETDGRHTGATAHLRDCATCRAEFEKLSDVMQLARAVEMPEPSPLFWEHFSRRVNAAVESEPAPKAPSVSSATGWRKFVADGWRPMALLGIACAALVLVVVLRPGDRPIPAPVADTADAVVAVTPVSETLEGSSDEALNVVAVLAQDLRADELQQVARPSADATGAAIEDLTSAQRAELVRLIKNRTGGAE